MTTWSHGSPRLPPCHVHPIRLPMPHASLQVTEEQVGCDRLCQTIQPVTKYQVAYTNCTALAQCSTICKPTTSASGPVTPVPQPCKGLRGRQLQMHKRQRRATASPRRHRETPRPVP